MPEKKNIHAGHRKNFKEAVIKRGGFDGMKEHEVLECMLYYALPRVDTNEIAHELINTCKGFDKVFSASLSLWTASATAFVII